MNIKKFFLTGLTILSMVVSGLSFIPTTVEAVGTSAAVYGPWAVRELAHDSAAGQIESVKTDRDLVVWTERDNSTNTRYLRVWDGQTIHLLAVMKISDWTMRNDFYDAVIGNYDVADGVVTWVMSDGSDLEVYCYRNDRVERLTNNLYDDVHPVTAGKRVAWTSYTATGAYNLMVANLDRGIVSVAAYPVMNYKASGRNIYWLNKLPGEDWFRVFINDGTTTRAIGKGDDRPIANYFLTDNNGSVAWEYSTKQWSYDKREAFVSNNGADAVRVLQRDVPPNTTSLQAVRGGELLIDSFDMLTTRLDNTSLLDTSASWTATVFVGPVMTKARFTSDAQVRHMTPETSSPLIYRTTSGFQDYISLDRIRHDMFEANADTVAAAYHENGGLMLFSVHDRQVTRIPTLGQDVRVIATSGNTTAFVYGAVGVQTLAVSSPSILVGNAAGTMQVSGRLVKSASNDSVYLVSDAGSRYVFPAEGQFYSWYNNFDSLQIISADSLAAMPLVGAVLYPTKTLLKVPSSPEVYTVGADGQLHWVSNAQVLNSLYGQDWSHQVHDLPAAFFAAYRVGVSVGDTTGYYQIAATK